jgi:hypothetical protein
VLARSHGKCAERWGWAWDSEVLCQSNAWQELRNRGVPPTQFEFSAILSLSYLKLKIFSKLSYYCAVSETAP